MAYPKKKGLTLMFKQEDHTMIKARAVELNIPMRDYILNLVKQEIKESRGFNDATKRN